MAYFQHKVSSKIWLKHVNYRLDYGNYLLSSHMLKNMYGFSSDLIFIQTKQFIFRKFTDIKFCMKVLKIFDPVLVYFHRISFFKYDVWKINFNFVFLSYFSQVLLMFSWKFCVPFLLSRTYCSQEFISKFQQIYIFAIWKLGKCEN